MTCRLPAQQVGPILQKEVYTTLLSNPNANADVLAISQWSRDCIAAGHQLYLPEVIDYELRRELVRAGKTKSLAKLDSLKSGFNFLPITSPAMLRAADLWAYARRQAAIIVATSNVSHISRFVAADLWNNIAP